MRNVGRVVSLRIVTCGSVGAGKSTIVKGLRGGEPLRPGELHGLFATDDGGSAVGLGNICAEFETPTRRFSVVDVPGNGLSPQGVAVAAASADLAIMVVDARAGVVTETRRHGYVAALFGIRHVILAVNMMDLAGHDAAVFARIRDDFLDVAGELGFASIVAIPVSALSGENLAAPAPAMRWYDGPTLLGRLETADVADDREARPFRFPVRSVAREDNAPPACGGTVVSGQIHVGDPVTVMPSGRTSRVSRIATEDGDREATAVGEAVVLTLADGLAVGRGDVLAPAGAAPDVTDQFRAHILWVGAKPMLPGRPYALRIGCQATTGAVSDLRYVVNVDTLEHLAARSLRPNEIGACNVTLDRAVAYDPYVVNRETGGFILFEREGRSPVGLGVIEYGLRRATNLAWQELQIDKAAHARLKRQKPCALWFTGLSGAGKSTVADGVAKRLHALGHHTYVLDGDNVRHGLNRDLGFTDADRVENIRRVAEVARLFVDAGLIVLVSFISPFRSERRMARELMEEGEFFEIFVDAPLEECERRDPKGLYRKARRGQIVNFTGIDSPYEIPLDPDLRLPTVELTGDAAADRVVAFLREQGIL